MPLNRTLDLLKGGAVGAALIRIPVLAVLAALGIAAPASAQIYSWRDASGTLVLSNSKPATGVEVRSYGTPKADSVRTTRVASSDRPYQFSDRFDAIINEHSRLNGIRPDLVRAVVQVESAFNPTARSPVGAMGLMQLMPATARQFGVSNPFNPIDNVRAGVKYLRELLDRYQNNEELALAAYNAGPAAVDKHGLTVPPYRETRNYVAQIGHMVGVNQAPARVERVATRIFKITEVVDGRDVVRYTDKNPAGATADAVAFR